MSTAKAPAAPSDRICEKLLILMIIMGVTCGSFEAETEMKFEL